MSMLVKLPTVKHVLPLIILNVLLLLAMMAIGKIAMFAKHAQLTVKHVPLLPVMCANHV